MNSTFISLSIPISDQAQRALTAGRILVDDLQLKIDETVETKPHLLAQIMLCLGVVGVFPKERVSFLRAKRQRDGERENDLSYLMWQHFCVHYLFVRYIIMSFIRFDHLIRVTAVLNRCSEIRPEIHIVKCGISDYSSTYFSISNSNVNSPSMSRPTSSCSR